MADVSRWRRRLLTLEFTALAILVGSMTFFRQHSAENPLHPAWLLIPALASLLLFLSFLGLMYLRWVAAAADNPRQGVQRLILIILTITLLALWAYGIGKTWQSIQQSRSGTAVSVIFTQPTGAIS